MRTLNLNVSKRTKSLIKKLSLPMFAMMMFSHSAYAAEPEAALRVNLKDGSSQIVLLSSNPIVTFEGSDCVIKSTDFDARYAMPDIDNVVFTSYDPASVDEIGISDVIIDLSDPEVVKISGMKAGGDVSIYNLSGVKLKQSKANDAGDATVNIGSLPKDVYFISIKETTFKIYKK